MVRLSSRGFVREVCRWLLVLTVTQPVSVSHHDLYFSDPDCNPVISAAGDEFAHVGPDAPAPSPDHCVICHWLKTAAGASPGLKVGAAPALTAVTALKTHHLLRIDTTLGIRASRAPPATSLL